MWKPLLLAFTMGITSVAAPQDRTKTGAPDSIPHPDAPTEAQTGRRYVGGGLTVTTRSHWAYVISASYAVQAYCTLACRGKKHLFHQQCDTNCDAACTTLHKHVFAPEFAFTTPLGGGAPIWTARLGRDIAAGGGQAGQAAHVANAVRDRAMKPIQDKIADYTYTYQSGHWNQSACSTHARGFRYSTYSLFGSYTVVKDGKVLARADTLLGTINIPHQAFKDMLPVEICLCQFVPDQRRGLGTDGGFVPSPSGETHGVPSMSVPGMSPSGTITLPRFGGLFLDNEGDGKYAAVGGGSNLGVTATYELSDLNNFTVTATNTTASPVSLALMPGTTFAPADGGYQSMVNLDLLQWTVPAGSSIEMEIPRSGPSLGWEPVKGYMACLDIGKKQPDGRAKYSLGTTTDSVLLELAGAMAQQRFRGPWNQGQMWAYRDGASIDEINKRLGLGVSTSHYLAGIYELEKTYGVALDSKKYSALWDPKLLLAHAATAEQVDWFVGGMVRKDARKLADWVRKNQKAFAPLFAADAKEWYIEHAAHVASALCFSSSVDVQAAGLEFLEKAVPVPSRAGLAQNAGLDGAVQLALGEGKHRARALKVVELYDPVLAKDLKTPPANVPFPPPPRGR